MRSGAHLGSHYSEDEQAGRYAHLRPQDVRQVRFTRAWFRDGYDQQEVDDFLDRIEHQLRGGHRLVNQVTAEDVVEQKFSATKFRSGYDQDEVDDFLDRIVTELRRER